MHESRLHSSLANGRQSFPSQSGIEKWGKGERSFRFRLRNGNRMKKKKKREIVFFTPLSRLSNLSYMERYDDDDDIS
jgi:hypothetical protein